MTITLTTKMLTYKSLGTATNCDEIGHCWHEGTAVGSWYCCRCGKYLSYSTFKLPSTDREEMPKC